MTEDVLDDGDYVWDSLASTPVRRAMLGRQRCDAIVRVAMEALEADAVSMSGPPLQRRVEQQVLARYRDNSGMGFMTLVVVWAISSIVQVLVIRWMSHKGEFRDATNQ